MTFSQFEMAWTNLGGMTKKFDLSPTTKEYKFHPTQKPVALYSWIMDHYGEKGDRIFDPFLGSGSSRIAAFKKGFDFYACELDEEYFEASEERFQKECFGMQKLPSGETIIQGSLF